jgi:flagellar biosynthesis/type III secretory pathway ATPase
MEAQQKKQVVAVNENKKTIGVNTSMIVQSRKVSNERKATSLERILDAYGANLKPKNNDNQTAEISDPSQPILSDKEHKQLKSALDQGIPAMELFKSLLQ